MPFIYNDSIKFKNPIQGNPVMTNIGDIDPYLSNVVLFFDGALTDSSPSPKVITNFGAVLSSAQTKYNIQSVLVSGAEYLTAPINTDFNFGTGDFTIEFWLRLNSAPGANGCSFIDSRIDTINTTGNYVISLTQDLKFVIIVINGSQFFANTAITLNQWTHIAFSRSSGILKICINGNIDATYNLPDNCIQSGSLKIMANAFRQFISGLLPNCYFDSLRITKGVGRYPSAFDPENDTYLD